MSISVPVMNILFCISALFAGLFLLRTMCTALRVRLDVVWVNVYTVYPSLMFQIWYWMGFSL